MNYEIQSRSDFKSGTELLVYVPEAELDCKALYTILNDRPSFILPFRHRAIDGQIEFTYQVGRRSKLNYLAGSRAPADYAQLWFNLLQPLLDCDDWFMNPRCFVLQVDCLYCDKATMDISYIYIPTFQPVSNQDMLKTMITEVARQNRVTDTSLENKVIWAIQDFNIQDFLQIIKPFRTTSVQASVSVQSFTNASPVAPPAAPPIAPSTPDQYMPVAPSAAHVNPNVDAAKLEAAAQGNLDISIQLPEKGKPPKEPKSHGGIFKKKEKAEKHPRGKSGSRANKNNQIMQGAASQPVYSAPVSHPVAPANQPLAPVYFASDQEDGITQLDSAPGTIAPHFRYVGAGGHPTVIEVPMQIGEFFTIGRFDVSIGAKQSSFEFDGHTKAVSRRHAAVERGSAGYRIVDLDSSAGTFLNGQRLPPNAPFALESGCRISFGNAGADYIWEI